MSERLIPAKPPNPQTHSATLSITMESPSTIDDFMPTFYVGQHESKRALPVSNQVVRQAQDCNVRCPWLNPLH